MKDYVSACTVSYINDTPLMDINYLEEGSGGPEMSVAVMPKSEKIVLFQMESRLHVDNMEKVMNLAVKGCKDVYMLLKRTVDNYSVEAAAALGSN